MEAPKHIYIQKSQAGGPILIQVFQKVPDKEPGAIF